MNEITWGQICRDEPRLKLLVGSARIAKKFQTRDQAYIELERTMQHLVGWHRDTAGPEYLYSADAYEIAHRRLIEAMGA